MIIRSIAELEAHYDSPVPLGAIVKEVPRITPHYGELIAASPFVALATCGPEGLDCSPRGEAPGFVRVVDEATVIMPDRRGNNRIDSLRNIVRDPRVALLFLLPGSGTTFRVNGRAVISSDPALLETFVIDGEPPPRSAIVITVDTCFLQCPKAILRSHLWDPAYHVDVEALPTSACMLAALKEAEQAKEPA